LWLKRLTYSAPVRYFAVAACGFVIDFLTYAAIVASGLSIYLANVAGFCVGATVNVALIRRFVFRNSRYSLPSDILLTFAINGIMLFFGMLVLWLLVERLMVNPYWAKLFTNGVTFVMNYVTRSIIFRKR
jgi:putative flippase GtrA